MIAFFIVLGLLLCIDAYPMADSFREFLAERKSQHSEDVFIFQEFYQSNVSKMTSVKRTYIEAGALNGFDLSNTWAFNKAFGWTGILVEASPKLFKSMLTLRRDSGDILVNGVLCNPKDAKKNVSYHYVDNGVRNTAVGGIWELMDDGFKQHFYGKLAIDDVKLQTYPTVKCMSLGAELLKYNITHVDYFSLDIEGAELDFLMHFGRYLEKQIVTIDIMSVEGYGDGVTAKDMRVIALLNRVGYTFVGHGIKQPAYGWGSMWFLRNNSVVHADYFRGKT